MPSTRHVALLPLLLLGGCYNPRGILMQAREIPASSIPGAECVAAAIGRVPGVRRLEIWGRGESSNVYLAYRIGREYASLSIGRENTDLRFSHDLSVNAGPRATARLDAMEPMMLAVNRRIEAECGLALEGRVSISRYKGRNRFH